MARGVNKVILIGNLGDEPLCRTTHGGCSVTNISMVTNEVRRNIDTGALTEYAEWHRVVMWGKLADIAKQYLHKGSQIYIEGKLRTRSFLDKQGQKRSVTEVVADEMQMLGTRSTVGMNSSLPQGNNYRPNPNATNQRSGQYGNMNQMHGMNNMSNMGGMYNSNAMMQQNSYVGGMGMGAGGYGSNAPHNIYDQQPSVDIDDQMVGIEDPMLSAVDSDSIGNSMSEVDMQAEKKAVAQEPDTKLQDDDIPF